MKQEQKDLLLKDLCARIPYGVIVGTTDNDGTIPNFWSLDSYNRLTEDVTLTNCELNANRLTYFCDVRPYLFPRSSMTEEQKIEEYKLMNSNFYTSTVELPDFYNKNHIDYLGLIPNGLAKDATNLYIY